MDVDSIAASANWLSQSAGAFTRMEHLDPNTGIFSATMASQCQSALVNPNYAALVSVALSDLHAFRYPISPKSFAHSFSILIFSVPGGGFGSRIYQAFGPPEIGYSLVKCVKSGSASKILPQAHLDRFVQDFRAFEISQAWDSKVQKLYQRLFECRLRMPHGYPIVPHTRIHVDILEARFMASILKGGW